MSHYHQSQRDYLQGLQAARLQGCEVSPDYFAPREHASAAKPVATVAADARLQPCSVQPIRVSEAPRLFESVYVARLRRAFTDAQCMQREAVKPALRALCGFLSRTDAKPKLTDSRTMGEALQALYSHYRQASREAASLMQRIPHDGRPPMALRVASTVAAMEVRHSERWQSTPHSVSDCRSLHTVPMHRSDRVNVTHEWNAAIDRGCTVSVFAAAEAKPKRSRTSGKVAPILKPKQAGRLAVSAAKLPRVEAD